MENIDDIQIGLTKFRADSLKYFSLFDKHIPRFENRGKSKKILLLGLNNEGMMLKCCAVNPKSEYWVADQTILSETLPLVGPEYDFKFFDGTLELYNIIKNCDMKFDCIIMNPPYEKNLHLKILAEAITHLKDDDSKVINLSPVQWLEDPLNKVKPHSDYSKFKKTILTNLESLDIISAEEGNKYFNIGLMANLGIYTCSLMPHSIYDYDSVKWITINKNIFNKLIITDTQQFPKLESFDEIDKRAFVPIKLIANPYRTTAFNICTSTFRWIKDKKLPDGRAWQDGIYKSKSMNANKHLVGIYFNSEDIAKNFYNSTYTNAFKYANKLVKGTNQHINVSYLPWLGDSINPRTGLKGYESEWTDEDFYKFFDITPDEQKIIEDTMAKYR